MPTVLNSNFAASSASLNLSRARDGLSRSLERLSSGKKINSAADDAGGLAVSYKLKSEGNRTMATMQNIKNALSYLQVQDGAMETTGRIIDRISQLRVMASDVTKNSGDIENYSKEFIELQFQLDQIKRQTFNGLSLFADDGGPPENNGMKGTGAYREVDGTVTNYQKFGRKLQVSPSENDQSISINVINFEFVTSYDVLALPNVKIHADGYAERITDFPVNIITEVLEKIADARAENGAEQNRVMHALQSMEVNYAKKEAAHGRIMDADIALESTRFAKHNVLVQASAAMTAQANQLPNTVLTLIQ